MGVALMPPHRSHLRNPAFAAAMAATGKTGRTLARETGLNVCTISHILNRRTNPTRQTAERIADALATTPQALGFLVYGEDV